MDIGTVIAATIGLIGVAFTLKSNNNAMIKQFQNDREISRNDKEYNLKKELIFNAIESYIAWVDYLSELPYLTHQEKLQKDSFGIGSKFYMDTSKLHLICKEETIKAIIFMENTIRESRSSALETMYRRAFIWQEIYKIKRYIDSGDNKKIDLLSNKEKELEILNHSLKSKIQNDLRDISIIGIELVILARKELGFENIHEDKYRMFMTSDIENAKIHFENYTKKLDSISSTFFR